MLNKREKRSIAVVSACMTAKGNPTFALNEVEVTNDEIENGIHYYLAEAQLLEDGFEEPFVHFDAAESPSFLHAAVREFLQQCPPVTKPKPLALAEQT